MCQCMTRPCSLDRWERMWPTQLYAKAWIRTACDVWYRKTIDWWCAAHAIQLSQWCPLKVYMMYMYTWQKVTWMVRNLQLSWEAASYQFFSRLTMLCFADPWCRSRDRHLAMSLYKLKAFVTCTLTELFTWEPLPIILPFPLNSWPAKHSTNTHSVVILDNTLTSFEEISKITEEEAGVQLLYLPPYSPDIIVSFSVAYSLSVRIPTLFKFCSSESCLYSLDRLSVNLAGLLVLPLCHDQMVP